MSVAFDTLKAARRLSAAGFTDEQAETLAGTFAEGITENLATKDDIALVRKDVEALDAKIDTSVEALRKDMKALDTKIDTSVEALHKDMKALDTKIDTSIEGLRKDMIAMKKDMTIMLGSIMVGGIVVMTLFDRLLGN